MDVSPEEHIIGWAGGAYFGFTNHMPILGYFGIIQITFGLLCIAKRELKKAVSKPNKKKTYRKAPSLTLSPRDII